MKDRTPLYPGRVKLVPVEGQENTYDMVREDSPTQPGTPLSKATFLKDATAALYGLGTDAVPDDALALLSRFQGGLGNEYVWAKTKTEIIEQEDSLSNVTFWSGNSGTQYTLYYADSVTKQSNGTYVLNSPASAEFYAQSGSSYANNFKGKYVCAKVGYGATSINSPNADGVYYIPADAAIRFVDPYPSSGPYSFVASSAIHLYGYKEAEVSYGYVNSPDSNAYPPAVSDGYTYTALGQVGSCAHIETGTYVGTGNNACSIQYERTPKFVAIFSKTTTMSTDAIPFAFFMPELGSGVLTYPQSSQNSYCYVANCYLRDNAFKTSNSYMDISGRTYQYIMLS